MMNGHQEAMATALESQKSLSEVESYLTANVHVPVWTPSVNPATMQVNDGRDGGSSSEDYEATAGAAWSKYGSSENCSGHN